MESLISEVEDRTQACMNGRGSTASKLCLRDAIELLRVVSVCTATWFMPLYHLSSCSLLWKVTNRVLAWALAYTREQHMHAHPLSSPAKSAIARTGLLCLRIFEGLPPHMIHDAVCKLPPTLAATLACLMCEQLPSQLAQDTLKAESMDSRGIAEVIEDYLGPGGPGINRSAMSKVLLSPALIEWTRMEFVAMMGRPSPSAAVRARERSDSKQWPPCPAEARLQWNRIVTLYSHLCQAYSAGGYTSGSLATDRFLAHRVSADPFALVRALRIVGRNVPAGMVGSEVRGRDSLLLKQQGSAIEDWLAVRGAGTVMWAQRDLNMVFGMAGFAATTVLHWLRHGDSADSGMCDVMRSARMVMGEMGNLQLVREHREGERRGGGGGSQFGYKTRTGGVSLGERSVQRGSVWVQDLYRRAGVSWS